MSIDIDSNRQITARIEGVDFVVGPPIMLVGVARDLGVSVGSRLMSVRLELGDRRWVSLWRGPGNVGAYCSPSYVAEKAGVDLNAASGVSGAIDQFNAAWNAELVEAGLPGAVPST
jgi:hypothetical protein